MKQTHETYVAAVARIATGRLTSEDKAKLTGIKLVYGAGQKGLRGVTYYDRWQQGETKAPFVEVCAFGQEDHVQLAGTTIHELGHVLAGWGAGHGKDWKDACARLGLMNAQAAGHAYTMDCFEGDIRGKIEALPKPCDGTPVAGGASLAGGLDPGTWGGLVPQGKPRSCVAGVGTRGGKSRGTGSGSRYRLYECACVPAIKVRTATDTLDATCNCCRGLFARK